MLDLRTHGPALRSKLGQRIPARGRVASKLGLAFPLLLSCRLDNPAFRDQGPLLRNESSAQELDTRAPSSAFSSQPTGDTSIENTPGVSPTSQTQSSSPPATTASTDTSSVFTWEPSGTWTPPQSFVYADFCKRGAQHCYPANEASSEPSYIQDHSGANNLLALAGPRFTHGTDKGSHSSLEPLVRTMYLKPGGSATQIKEYQYQGGDVAFDIWFLADQPTNRNWALFELKGVLALYRDSDGSFVCKAKGTNSEASASVTLSEERVFQHLACMISGGKVQLLANGHISKSHPTQLTTQAASAPALIGKQGDLSSTNEFQGRYAMIRIWDNVQAMNWSLHHEFEVLCKELSIC